MRKLFPVPVLVCLLAVPTALGAAPSPDTDGDRVMITAPLGNDPLDAAEADNRLEAAEREAEQATRKAASKPAEKRPVATEKGPVATPPHLQAIAACESGGNPQAVSASGAYRGKYQFSPSTWASVGGSGDPAAASEAEQDRRAAMLYARSGSGQWPVCGS